MNKEEIKELFLTEVHKADFKEKTGVSKQVLYNYKNRTSKISLMLEVLLKVGAIKVTKI